jgi:hypothetical protein
MSQFVIAKRDTFVNLMMDTEIETSVLKGTWMFHITSDHHTRYLNPDEICVYMPKIGTNYTYKGDWEVYESA